MRLGEWKRVVRHGLPCLILVSCVGTLRAQFREVQPDGEAAPAVEIRLTPTKESFVPPRPSGSPTVADASRPIQSVLMRRRHTSIRHVSTDSSINDEEWPFDDQKHEEAAATTQKSSFF